MRICQWSARLQWQNSRYYSKESRAVLILTKSCDHSQLAAHVDITLDKLGSMTMDLCSSSICILFAEETAVNEDLSLAARQLMFSLLMKRDRAAASSYFLQSCRVTGATRCSTSRVLYSLPKVLGSWGETTWRKLRTETLILRASWRSTARGRPWTIAWRTTDTTRRSWVLAWEAPTSQALMMRTLLANFLLKGRRQSESRCNKWLSTDSTCIICAWTVLLFLLASSVMLHSPLQSACMSSPASSLKQSTRSNIVLDLLSAASTACPFARKVARQATADLTHRRWPVFINSLNLSHTFCYKAIRSSLSSVRDIIDASLPLPIAPFSRSFICAYSVDRRFSQQRALGCYCPSTCFIHLLSPSPGFIATSLLWLVVSSKVMAVSQLQDTSRGIWSCPVQAFIALND